MKIGEAWGDEIWGEWKGGLILTYDYKITGKEILNLPIGEVECYVVESTATSEPINTVLTAWFSEKHGFVKFEYKLMNEVKVNMWMTEIKTGLEFNDASTLFKTGEYIK